MNPQPLIHGLGHRPRAGATRGPGTRGGVVARALRALVACSVVAPLAACGGGGTTAADMAAPDQAQPQGSYAALRPLFVRACNFSSCHGAAAKGDLSLIGDAAYCNLVGTKQGATAWPAALKDFPRRVVPGDRGRSFLYKKLILTPAESGSDKPYGTTMPQGGALAAAEIEAFGAWIDKGAKDDTGGAGNCP